MFRGKPVLTVLAVLMMVATHALAFLQIQPEHPAPRPLSVEEQIALIDAVTYEEATPYFEARFIWRRDGIAWRECGQNNFANLPDRPTLRWLAEEATARFLDATEDTPGVFTLYQGKRIVGDSPWGVFAIPKVRALMEQPFEEAKQTFIDLLREHYAREQAKKSAAGTAPG